LARVTRMLAIDVDVGAPVAVAPPATPGYLTTEQAAKHLGFASASGIRGAVNRDELHPVGRGAGGHICSPSTSLNDSFVPGQHGIVDPAVERLGGIGTEMRISGKKTRYPGVFKIDEKMHRIRVVGTNPKTGKRRQAERVLEGVTAAEAALKRAELQAQLG